MAFPLAAILGGAGLVGKLFGGAGKGAAQERALQNQQAQDVYRTQQGAALNFAGLNESAVRDRADRSMSAPSQRARQVSLAQMLLNYQPRTVSGLPPGVRIPQTSGGLVAALRSSPEMRRALENLTKQALMAQESGSDVPGLPDRASAVLPAPAYQKPGKFESIASGIGLVGGFGGGLADMFGGQTPRGGGARNRAVFGG